MVGGVVDLPLAAEEHEHVACTDAAQLLDGVGDGRHLVGAVLHRPVADVDRERPPADLDHRRTTEVLGEAGRVDRRRGDHDVQVVAPFQQAVQVAEEEVDVQAALVGLVDDDRVVAAQHPVALDLGEQDPVGHHLDPRVHAHPIGEPHGIPHRGTELDAHLLGDPLGDRARRQPPWLGVTDHPVRAAPRFEAQPGQLGALARSRLPGHHDDAVVAQRGDDLVAPFVDRQRHRADGTGADPRRVRAGVTRREQERPCGRERSGAARRHG